VTSASWTHPPAPSLEREGEKPFTPPSLLKRRGLGDEFKPVTFTNQALCCALFSFNFNSPCPVPRCGSRSGQYSVANLASTGLTNGSYCTLRLSKGTFTILFWEGTIFTLRNSVNGEDTEKKYIIFYPIFLRVVSVRSVAPVNKNIEKPTIRIKKWYPLNNIGLNSDLRGFLIEILWLN
jgi:hypothetical protein